ncbi:MAG: hypothetical protein MRERV_27c007 [Mycoplasmataceae bacterium RV_VA103A]|nr:MAG: hypothetical protein MRERV_27c007 [Mycoplasmataceae bacterium RV_VA103A]
MIPKPRITKKFFKYFQLKKQLTSKGNKEKE